MHSDTKPDMLSSRLLSLNNIMFKMKINSVGAQVISISQFNAPCSRQIFCTEPYSDRLVLPCYQVSGKWASSNSSSDYKLCSCSPGYILVSSAILPSSLKQELSNSKFELIQQIQGCLLSSVNAFTISYGYHIKVILSSKPIHCKTTPSVQHLELSLIFLYSASFSPGNSWNLPQKERNIPYLVIFSLYVMEIGQGRSLFCAFPSPFTDFALYL